MKQLKITEIISPQDTLGHELEMVRGGNSDGFSICLKGCIAGENGSSKPTDGGNGNTNLPYPGTGTGTGTPTPSDSTTIKRP